MDYSRFQGQPFEIISRHACRYTGIFDRVEPETLTICLRDVYNHGTEDRPAPVRYPGSAANMGWIRFHTESIESMRLAENYVPPSQPEPPQDPAIASMSRQEPPPATAPPQQQRSESAASRHAPQHTPRSNQSIDTAMDRVQASLSSLSVENQAGPSGQYHGQGGQGSRPRRQPQGPSGGGWVNPQRQRQPPEAPDAEFDFSKANEAFEKERALMKQQRKASVAAESAAGENKNGDNDNDDDDDEEEQIVLKGDIHPMALKPQEPKSAAGAGVGTGGAYKKSSFFDDLTSSTSRVSIQQERGRNLDTFGEAGGAARGGMRGGYGGGGGRGRGGQGGGSGGYARGGGYGGGQGYGGRGNGRGRGGYGRGRGGYGQSQPTAEWA